jgi:hypothetical protein
MEMHHEEALALTAIIQRLMDSKGNMLCLWMNIDQIPVALKFYDSLASYSNYVSQQEDAANSATI